MATRWYFTSSATTPANSPAFGAWTRTTEGVRRIMATTKDGTAMASKTIWANGAAAADESALAIQFSSDTLPVGTAFTTSQTIKCYIRCNESAGNDNINRQPIRVAVYNGTTLQATLKGLGHIGPNTTEWPTTLTNKTLADGDALAANYTSVSGDYLVVEVGGQVSAAGGTSVTGTMSFGSDSGTDLGENESDTSAFNPWFEWSGNLLVMTGTIASSMQKATASLAGTMTPTFASIRPDIIAGLDSAQSEATGWNAEVRDKEVVTSVVRTSDTIVTITLSASPAYNITAQETITVTVPAVATAHGQAITGSPTPAISVLAPTGTIVSSMRAATASLAGAHKQTGAIASTMQRATASLAGSHKQTGSIASTIQRLSAALAGTQQPRGSIASTMQRATATLTGTQAQTGTIASSLQKATASLSGYMKPAGAIVSTMRPSTTAATGLMGAAGGAIVSTMQVATSALAGTQKQTGAIVSALQKATASLAGNAGGQPTGTIASTMQKATAALAGVMQPEGTIASAMQSATASLAGTHTAASITGTAASSLQKATASLSGTHEQAGAIAATMQIATVALTGSQGQTGTIAATMQMVTAVLFGSQLYTGTIAATLQRLQATATDLQASPRIVSLDGSYVPITNLDASVLLAVIDGSYVPITQLEGAVS
jgi:hypothetical protein